MDLKSLVETRPGMCGNTNRGTGVIHMLDTFHETTQLQCPSVATGWFGTGKLTDWSIGDSGSYLLEEAARRSMASIAVHATYGEVSRSRSIPGVRNRCSRKTARSSGVRRLHLFRRVGLPVSRLA